MSKVTATYHMQQADQRLLDLAQKIEQAAHSKIPIDFSQLDATPLNKVLHQWIVYRQKAVDEYSQTRNSETRIALLDVFESANEKIRILLNL